MRRLYLPLGQIILFNYSITCFPKIKTLLLVFLQIPLQQWRNLIFTKWEIFSSVFIFHIFSPSFDSFLSPPVFVLHRIIKCPFLGVFSWKEKYFQPSSSFSFPLILFSSVFVLHRMSFPGCWRRWTVPPANSVTAAFVLDPNDPNNNDGHSNFLRCNSNS